MSKQSYNKEKLITSGYPRSGNVFLNYCFKSMYYPEEIVSEQHHITTIFKEHPHVFTPLRNPLDCMGSWNLFQQHFNFPMLLEDDIRYYIRFHNAVLDSLKSITLLDFDVFTSDLTYLSDKVRTALELEPVSNSDISTVKELMLKDRKQDNLPRNNQDALNEIKYRLQNTPNFDKCIALYEELKGAM